MRILERIEINNFQCHKNSVIELSPTGLTVITGPSHHGKSAVVRAVRWVLYNRPHGDEFFRHGTRNCSVILAYSDGVAVERKKTPSLNQYWIWTVDENGEKQGQLFEGFGYDVPLEVQKVTGCYNYKIDDKKTLYLNIAEQGEGLFLGSKTATDTQRSKILGKLAGTEDVDRANKELGTDIYHAKEDKKKYEADIEEKDEKIKEYRWVNPLGEKVAKLEALQKQIEADSERLKLLELMQIRLDNLNDAIEKIEQDLEWYYDVLPDVSQIISGIEPDMPLLVDLMQKNSKLKDIAEQIIEQKNIINNTGRPEDALKAINKVSVNATHLGNKQQQLQRIIGLNRQLVQNDINIGRNRTVVKLAGNPKRAIEELNQCFNNINTYTTLTTKKMDYNMYSRQIRTQELVIEKKYSGVDKAKITIDGLNSKVIELSSLEDKKREYDNKSKEVAGIAENVELFYKVIEKAETETQKAKDKYKEVLKNSGICPYCGSDVEDECLDHVV